MAGEAKRLDSQFAVFKLAQYHYDGLLPASRRGSKKMGTLLIFPFRIGGSRSSYQVMKEAFLRTVVASHGRQLTRFFASQLSEPLQAQDLVQEVYLRLLNLERPELIRCPKAYVYRVATNIAREHWSKRSSRPSHIAFEEVTERTLPDDASLAAARVPEDAAETTERLQHLTKLLDELAPKVRAALIWAHRDGHTYEEIGERLAVSKNRVKKYLARAIAHCRKSASDAASLGSHAASAMRHPRISHRQPRRHPTGSAWPAPHEFCTARTCRFLNV